MPTQQQEFLRLALTHVEAVRTKKDGTRTIYGGLCHTFPIMVLTNGLCQALAFVCEKKGSATAADSGEDAPRQVAYACLWSHAAAIIGVNEGALLDYLRGDGPQGAGTARYLRDTRRILDAWIYYKRFAVSILHVEAGTDVGDAATPDTAPVLQEATS